MIKYRVYSKTIEKMEIERETDHTIFYKSTTGSTVCERKQSSYYNYFDTFEDARKFILNRINLSLGSLRAQTISKQKDLEEVFLMEER